MKYFFLISFVFVAFNAHALNPKIIKIFGNGREFVISKSDSLSENDEFVVTNKKMNSESLVLRSVK